MHNFLKAIAAATCLRSLAGFGFPLFAPAMFNKLGYGKGNTILACLAIILGCPAYVNLIYLIHWQLVFILTIFKKNSPIVLWKYGRQIRMNSKYARKPLQHTQGEA